ncbi:uncharacterized protein J8A68_003425 [[Candida] subhashii]|uniref:RRM domain-containing protein n=1 Tax=[Candida] subhashii TaxID=561895 RepID=A0A8J5QJ49_9ASCO|nr:uncharacterized protein J8A68_003425 [[Candida] subhashii]KAG7663043.1 hypothetical protein J8A68_003425 [[Candida] subhashii]
MSSVIASNIPSSVSNDKIREFFSFCGTVIQLESILNNGEFKSVRVEFASPKAVETALLLNDAEFGGDYIKVDSDDAISAPPQPPRPTSDAATTGETDAKTEKEINDLPQEDKPKFAIMAQLLSEGYLISDQIIAKALEFDKQHGFYNKFVDFVDSLDKKYVHLHDPESPVAKNVAMAQGKAQDLQSVFETSRIGQYLVSAANHPLGIKIHDFYRGVTKDVLEVHEEAKRLAELKKQRAGEETTKTAQPEKK